MTTAAAFSLAPVARAPFFTACPVCGGAESSHVVGFTELLFVRCLGCGLIYKAEQVSRLGVGYEEEYFRFNRAKYLERWSHRVRKCRRQLLACLEFAPHAKTLLDIGCSAGYVLEAGRREGLAPTGLDLSAFAVGLCRERGYEAVQGSLSQLPLPDAAFDVVTCKHTLEHIEDPMKGVREIARVLRPGGVAFLVVPDAAYWKLTLMPRTGRSFRPDRRGWQHHVYFFERNLEDACRRAGLEPTKTGKDVFRRRLAHGPRAVWEALRFGFVWAWNRAARATHTAREIQLIARKPAA